MALDTMEDIKQIPAPLESAVVRKPDRKPPMLVPKQPKRHFINPTPKIPVPEESGIIPAETPYLNAKISELGESSNMFDTPGWAKEIAKSASAEKIAVETTKFQKRIAMELAMGVKFEDLGKGTD